MKVPETAKRIRKLREGLGLSQAMLAAKLGLSQSTMRDWESGKMVPDPCMGMILAKLATGEDRKYFLGRAGQHLPSLLGLARELLTEEIEPREVIPIAKVRRTVRGNEGTGKLLPMPSVMILHPSTTFCFVLEKSEAVVDAFDAGGNTLFPFLGKLVLVEFAATGEGEDYPSWLAGLRVGAFYLRDERRVSGRIQWFSDFVPLIENVCASEPTTIGIWTEPQATGSDAGSVATQGPIATAQEFKPKLAAGESAGKDTGEWYPSPELICDFNESLSFAKQRIERAARQMRLIAGCKIIGTVLAQFPASGVKAEEAR